MKKVMFAVLVVVGNVIQGMELYGTIAVSQITHQRYLQNAAREAEQEGREEKIRLLYLVNLMLNKQKKCTIISRIQPYVKTASFEAELTPEEWHGGAIPGRYASLYKDNTQQYRPYKKNFITLCDSVYEKKPEEFARTSAFSDSSWIKPSDISHVVAIFDGITELEKTKFLNIIHALKSGIIQSDVSILSMQYHDELNT
ncbi:hypothetical protein A3J41_01430 [candidate division TM6 bacterium RIFCSPHIGHO2_12_FULL_38_8]|nr:MAG: hypothetical protein A3J41_01430 [candidate division TM6 bacterium RIFCSPHIGHO2_12_FULL_38_8]